MNKVGYLREVLNTWFGSSEHKGALSKLVPSYEYRPQQVEMAMAITEALENQKHLIVEAGTGIGKTFAYLAPIVASGKKVIVSTATKILQEQLVKRDIPLLLTLLDMNTKPENYLCVLKGRSNYVCKRKLKFLEGNAFRVKFDQIIGPTIDPKVFIQFMKILIQWLKNTETGDISEFATELVKEATEEFQDIPFLEEKLGYLLGISSDQCPGLSCGLFPYCFVTTIRKRAQKAKLVVVNHYLLFTDLVGKFFKTFDIIPPADLLVFDEAHHLPDVIARALSISYHSNQLSPLMDEVALITKKDGKIWEDFVEIGNNIREHHNRLYSILSQPSTFNSDDSREYRVSFSKALKSEENQLSLKNILLAISECYDEITLLFDEKNENHGAVLSMARKNRDLLREFAKDEPSEGLKWFEIGRQGFSIHITPLNGGTIVSDMLLNSYSSIVFTSATIAIANVKKGPSFDYFKKEIGFSAPTDTLVVGSPYNYRDQMVCFIPPEDFPLPDSPYFIEAILNYSAPLIKASPGGTLFLCTSYRNMRAIASGLREAITDRYILVQGEASRAHILEEFRRDKNSILVATGTFWEGIDIPGESLQVLFIDKLPFPSPVDPLVEGSSRRLEELGYDSFKNYFLPKMILTLRQGIGRLIRSSKDRGLVGIFDVRIRIKSYGREVLLNLPPCRIVERVEDLLPEA
ncbi:MAG: ATP-dependent DNA helicase [Syntrophobacterales bacterium]|nr:ATP-dependent DNA helicase [Syntrophobacterales bacterium]